MGVYCLSEKDKTLRLDGHYYVCTFEVTIRSSSVSMTRQYCLQFSLLSQDRLVPWRARVPLYLQVKYEP